MAARPSDQGWIALEKRTVLLWRALHFESHAVHFEALQELAVRIGRPLINEQEFGWLQMFANQAAVGNARAFSELDRLRQQLESHNAYLKEEILPSLGLLPM